MSLISGQILKRFQELSQDVRTNATKARAWFRQAARAVTGRGVSANDIMKQGGMRLNPNGKFRAADIGRLHFFFYDAKLKDELPYWDRFPLCIPISFGSKSFLGLNLHYLTPVLRARLLDGLYSIYEDKYLNEDKKLQLTYQLLKGNSRLRWFKPCVKKYLYSHVRSKFYRIDPLDWDFALMLPCERFEKMNKTAVWKESERKLGVTRNKSRHIRGK